MEDKRVSPFGSWKSPITSDLIVSETVGLSQPKIEGDDFYWLEMRPSEGGRNVVVKRGANGVTRDVTPKEFNVRTRVHEYGGGDYVVSQGVVYFSNFVDQRLYSQSGTNQPQPITPAAQMRYADAVVDPGRRRLICVREDHTLADREAVNTIVSLSLDGNEDCGQVLASGYDFFSNPRISPDGNYLAWLSWNHPNMPWDGSELWLARFFDDGQIVEPRLVAGSVSESIFQPEWSPDGRLYFVSDRNGWWNLFRLGGDSTIETVCERKAEFGMPQWVFGVASYDFASPGEIVCAYIEQGISRLGVIDTATGKLTAIDTNYTDTPYLRAANGHVLFRGGSPREPISIVHLDLRTGKVSVIRRSNNVKLDSEYISLPEPLEFPTSNGRTAHAFFYAPKNRDYSAPDAELPPLLVKSHGGPTAAATTAQSLSVQYWTSRGIAILDVNYGGSTGYGREYRERLNDSWGIVDVDDCVNGALFLAESGKVDRHRMMITGGSAGGYTTLCALTFRKAFKAGASHFGVSDAEALAKDTHKFESRYLDGLMGPYPERRDIYHERSPINFTDQLSCPVIFFQGLEDKVVPPNQAELMVQTLREKKIPVAYLAFEGEQHGFRQAKNIKRALDAELYFYSRVFGFKLADEVDAVEIENLPQL
jgi:dipeptidyl aminopeptidase/acylaminoacyl peptidase